MFKSIFLIFMHLCFNFTKWNLGANEENFILGPIGTGLCFEGTPIMDETTCREACRALDIRQAEIFGYHRCYKDYRELCFQNGHHGSGARIICKKSELIPGRFKKENKNPKSLIFGRVPFE